jgi:hypothetical protein
LRNRGPLSTPARGTWLNPKGVASFQTSYQQPVHSIDIRI